MGPISRDAAHANHVTRALQRALSPRCISSITHGIYNETWTSLEELNNRIFELNDLYNNRIKSGLTYSRYDKFVKDAQPIMSNYSSVSGQRISLLKSIHSQRKTLPGRIKNGCWTLPCMILPVSAGSIWDWHMKSKLWILLSSCNMFRNTLIVS